MKQSSSKVFKKMKIFGEENTCLSEHILSEDTLDLESLGSETTVEASYDWIVDKKQETTASVHRYWKQGVELLNKPVAVSDNASSDASTICSAEIETTFDPSSGCMPPQTYRRKQVPSALVLAPTRELAGQVQKEFKESAPNLSSACLYGGVPISNQSRALGLGINIAVGTPVRIIDLVERGSLDLSQVKFLVLDEADQMLAIGFQEDVECILRYLPAKKQCMLFSATMPSWVSDLSRRYLKGSFGD